MNNFTLKDRLRARWKIIVVILVLVGTGSYYFWGGLTQVLDEYQLIHGGETAQGFIIDAWEDYEPGDSGPGFWWHTAIYTYQLPHGRELTGEINGQGRLKSEFRSLEQPYPVEVTYLLKNPAVSRISGALPDSILGIIRGYVYPYWFFSAILLFIGFGLLWQLIREENIFPKRYRRL